MQHCLKRKGQAWGDEVTGGERTRSAGVWSGVCNRPLHCLPLTPAAPENRVQMLKGSYET